MVLVAEQESVELVSVYQVVEMVLVLVVGFGGVGFGGVGFGGVGFGGVGFGVGGGEEPLLPSSPKKINPGTKYELLEFVISPF